MATMDTSLVSVALPQMAIYMETSLATISWVMVAYLLANASLQIIVGRLSDLTAPGRLFLAGVTLFAGASALAGLSPSLGWLLASRVAQGAGGALMLGVSPKLITLAFAEKERGLALGMFSAGFATGVTVGAPLSGLLLTFMSWRSVFFVNPILGVLVLAVGSRLLTKFPTPRTWDWPTLDPWGGLVLIATLALFILTLGGVRDHGLGDPRDLVTFLGATGGLVLLLLIERRHPHPLIHRELWLNRNFLLGSFGVMLAFTTVMGSFFLLPFFLGQIFSYSPGKIGLMLAVLSMSNATMSFLGGYAADRIGNTKVLRTGLGLIVVGLLSMTAASPQISTANLAGRLALVGMGLGLFSAPNLNEILRGMPPALMGLAATTNAVLKNLGSLLGVILLVAALGFGQAGQLPLKAGVCLGIECYHQAFWVAAGLAALNFVVNLLPRGADRENRPSDT